jgi:hypothetical protein
MDPKAGMLRLVFGLGTRAVNRVEDDHPRIVSLDRPQLQPHHGPEESVGLSQRKADILDISLNSLRTVELENVLTQTPEELKNMIFSEEAGRSSATFEKLFADGDFTAKMQSLMKVLETAYKHPVDIEFAANLSGHSLKINLLQCRPLQQKDLQQAVSIPENTKENAILLSSDGNFMGGNISEKIRYAVYVDPERYSLLKQQDKYETARIIGKINAFLKEQKNGNAMLLGPGRWGTSTPSMGVPVSFYEINHVRCIAEIAFKSGNLIPELSFGTHMFQDLVESNIFYIALFPGERGCVLNVSRLKEEPNILENILPLHSRMKDVIFVADFKERGPELISDIASQKVICFFGGS